MFFKGFPQIRYKFGNENSETLFQNLSVYVDIIDQIKDDTSFYLKYNILDGDRPDQVSQNLYGNTDYYWTFFFLNDKLKLRGWPLSSSELTEKVRKRYPNTVLVTTDSFYEDFNVGLSIEGLSSGETATIISRDLNLGQITVSGTHSFEDGETIKLQLDEDKTFTLNSSSEEYNSARFYRNGSGQIVDITPGNPGALLTEVTQIGYYRELNEDLKDIRVLRPDTVDDIFRAYKIGLRENQ